MSNFLKNVIRETGNEYGTIVSDGLATADVSGYVDTGSFVFNALCSGSLYGGLPQNKITAIAGESATGKTFFLLGVCQSFLEKNVDGNIALFPSWLEHYTDQAKPGQERITIGIDLIPTEFFNIGVKEDKKSHWEKL